MAESALTTPTAAIRAEIDARLEALNNAIIYNLRYIGEKVVNIARELPSPSAAELGDPIPPHQPNYIDWTANLRSSIGYIIAVDGKVVESGAFTAVRGGDQGAADGKAYAEEIIKRYPKGYALVVVAGMSYASYVTAKGYDVLESAQLEAEELVKQMATNLTDALKQQ
jgi:hypothetical protein